MKRNDCNSAVLPALLWPKGLWYCPNTVDQTRLFAVVSIRLVGHVICTKSDASDLIPSQPIVIFQWEGDGGCAIPLAD